MAETFFSLLGLAQQYELDTALLEERYRILSQKWHPDRQGGLSQKNPVERRQILLRAAELNQAYKTLKDDRRRAVYLLQLYGAELSENSQEKMQPEFLMEILELQESLSEAQAQKDANHIHMISLEIGQRTQEAKKRLEQDFKSLEQGNNQVLGSLRQTLGELRYYDRFAEQLAEKEGE